jgi:hypothetical protein
MYEVGKTYEFEITSFKNKKDLNGELLPYVSVNANEYYSHDIRVSKWQIESTWNFKTLKCRVESINDFKLKLINVDNRHPFYEVDGIYDFKVLSFKQSKSKEGRVFDIIILEGLDGLEYGVSALPGQKIKWKDLNEVKCQIKEISFSKFQLSQIVSSDYLFNSFEEILYDKSLKKTYFDNLFKQVEFHIYDLPKFIDQYNNKKSFWVFTYTNSILPQLFTNEIQKFNYKKTLEINGILLKFENYIIHSGIITSFKNEELKSNTIKKTKRIIEDCKTIEKVIKNLLNDPIYPFDNFEINSDLDTLFNEIFHTIHFANFELLNFEGFFEKFLIFFKTDNIDENHRHRLRKILNKISKNKTKVFKTEKEESFSLSPSSIFEKSISEKEISFLNWSYCEILICEKLNNHVKLNNLIGKTIRYFLKQRNSYLDKENLITYSHFFITKSDEKNLPNPFYYDKEVKLDDSKFEEIRLIIDNDEQNPIIEELINLKNKSFKVHLTNKIPSGFFINYKGLIGFLPSNQITNKNLKTLISGQYNFEVDVECLNISKKFKYFLVKQVNENYTELNPNKIEFTQNEVYEFIITKVLDIGIHVSVINSNDWGFVPKNLLFRNSFLSKFKISEYFEKGEHIKLVFHSKNIDYNNNIFSLLDVRDIDSKYFDDLESQKILKINNSNDLFEIEEEFDFEDEKADFENMQIKVAFCLEQYSWIQSDLNEKINNLVIAKQFYINKGVPRGYLIEIFIKYFEILLEIKKCLSEKSIQEFESIREKSLIIKSELNQKTIEKYPETGRLIYFVDIISLFNLSDKKTLDTLYDYCNKYGNDNINKDLSTIAKLTLANNLILSESVDDIFDFTLKNLKTILNYLLSGLLSLNDSVEDKDLYELLKLIQEDESEVVEFKSSLWVPNEFNDQGLKDLIQKRITHSSMKTLVAFANTNGGTLLIGVSDDKKINSLKQDYSLFKKPDKERDEFGKKFDSTIKNYIGENFFSLISKKFISTNEGDVLRIDVSKSSQVIFLLKDDRGEDKEELYVRALSSTIALKGYSLSSYIIEKERHKNTKIV